MSHRSGCVNCGGHRLTYERAYACDDEEFAARVYPELAVLRCESCHLVQVDHPAVHRGRFQVWRRQRDLRRAGHVPSDRARSWLEARARATRDVVCRALRGVAPTRVYQLGAGAGLDLIALQEKFPHLDCHADWVDSGEPRAESIQLAPLDDGPYDAVLMTHVLAQAPEPVRAVQRVTEALRPGGVLLVETTNDLPASLERRRGFEPQLTFFDVHSLRAFFETRFDGVLEIDSLATAGPRIEDSRLRPVECDLDDDARATDRLMVRIALRRI